MAKSPVLQTRMPNRADFIKACFERGDEPCDLIRAFANAYIAEHEAAKHLDPIVATQTPRTDENQ